jgi:acetylglutamate kinase
MMEVLKIGGNEIEEPEFLRGLGETVAAMDGPITIVHGGGRAIANMQARLGLETVKVDGLRVTDAESLAISQMVLSGHTNKTIVVALLAAGVQAVGISGVDGGLLRCIKKQHPAADLGYVGQIVEVQPQLIHSLVAQGITPVISPISLGLEGQVYNINADEAAGAIAAALEAKVLNFISNVPGVLDQENRTIPKLTAAESQLLIQRGVIRDGMIPKVLAALEVIDRGVPSARIVNLPGLPSGQGTLFIT